ncbi:MAG: YcjX family protein [Devosiaceae bacterium]
MPELSLLDDVRLGARSLVGSATDLATPSLRIGVTGLSRAGKTVFLTSLVHALLHGGHLPALQASRSGRLIGATLSRQPHDDIARFALEDHVHDLLHNRQWPSSTRQIAELRITLRFEPTSAIARALGRTSLHLDMVDYPGEWLLDLPLLDQDYATFSKDALTKARAPERKALAKPFLDAIHFEKVDKALNERRASELAAHYTNYLQACREGETALSMLPPGRFLMPGDLEGSPALTFVPLEPPKDGRADKNSLYATMEHRFEAYKRVVVKPFFINHFATLDRQIVLVDTLAAINAGPAALQDLRDALSAILSCFRAGQNSILSSLFGPRIDRIVFAATKADHLHHSQHDQLEAILDHLVQDASKKASFSGADVETLAIASVRATREASAKSGGDTIGAVAGVPIKGETINGQVFDGEREVAIFPGDLPEDPAKLLGTSAKAHPLRFVKFRPPKLDTRPTAKTGLPHIRLDRLLQFLLGDKLA